MPKSPLNLRDLVNSLGTPEQGPVKGKPTTPVSNTCAVVLTSECLLHPNLADLTLGMYIPGSLDEPHPHQNCKTFYRMQCDTDHYYTSKYLGQLPLREIDGFYKVGNTILEVCRYDFQGS